MHKQRCVSARKKGHTTPNVVFVHEIELNYSAVVLPAVSCERLESYAEP